MCVVLVIFFNLLLILLLINEELKILVFEVWRFIRQQHSHAPFSLDRTKAESANVIAMLMSTIMMSMMMMIDHDDGGDLNQHVMCSCVRRKQR